MNFGNKYANSLVPSEEICSVIEHDQEDEDQSGDESSVTEGSSLTTVYQPHSDNSPCRTGKARTQEVGCCGSTVSSIINGIRRSTTSLINRSAATIRSLFMLACFANFVELAIGNNETTEIELDLTKVFLSNLCLMVYISDFPYTRGASTSRYELRSYLQNISETDLIHCGMKKVDELTDVFSRYNKTKKFDIVSKMVSKSSEMFSIIIHGNAKLNSSDKEIALDVVHNRSLVMYGPKDDVNMDICNSTMEYVCPPTDVSDELHDLGYIKPVSLIVLVVFVIPAVTISCCALNNYRKSRKMKKPTFNVEVINSQDYAARNEPDILDPSSCLIPAYFLETKESTVTDMISCELHKENQETDLVKYYSSDHVEPDYTCTKEKSTQGISKLQQHSAFIVRHTLETISEEDESNSYFDESDSYFDETPDPETSF
ncbi:putative membrane protein [Candidatus Ichthyocystis hellenicum]|uniref:Putative membrane protein n=1 Tax=Candidatus Ichthyocystis hellenicum TaxID=1561003 RepID=A0A0S4M5Z2_9BURK|nr:hypothetical protein [Candidatus Ichthyocystis hellenicum]CUT18396.1 putative membrane protein [Candidatus Ichthyocystis hellenicum]